MRYLILLPVFPAVVSLSCLVMPGKPPGDRLDRSLLDLPEFKDYKVDAYLAAAAKLQAVGREKAAVILADLARVMDRDIEGRRVIVLCRMLFRARADGEFRRPGIGGPCFLGLGEDCRDWPLEPIELVDGVPFLIVRGYTLGGYPEPAKMYLDYCLQNCDWNTEVFKPKTAEEKRKALVKLVESPRWKEPLTDEAKKVLASQIE